MKRLALLACCAAVIGLSQLSSKAAQDPHPLFPIVQHGMWGYMDRAGNVVIRPRFDGAEYFSEGLARVKFGFGSDARYGYINETGRLVIGHRFNDAADFSEGLAAVCVARGADEHGGKWGYVDRKGRLAIRAQFSYAGPFRNGLARTFMPRPNDSGRLSCIDRNGKALLHRDFSAMDEGYKEFGYIHSEAQLIDRKTIRCLEFSEGLAVLPDDEEVR